MATGPLILGATGQIGRAWQTGAVSAFARPPQFLGRRTGPDGLGWDILAEPAPRLACSGIISLAGSNRDDAATMIALAAGVCDLGEALDVPVLLASTQAVYGPLDGPMTEDRSCAPSSAYGKARLAMEASVADRPRVTCLRIGNIPGADLLFRNARLGPVKLDQWSNGTGPRRTMIGLRTLAHACDTLLRRHDLPPILNLAQPGLIEMEALLDAARARWSWQEAGPDAVQEVDLDVTRAQALLGLEPANADDLLGEARACGCWP